MVSLVLYFPQLVTTTKSQRGNTLCLLASRGSQYKPNGIAEHFPVDNDVYTLEGEFIRYFIVCNELYINFKGNRCENIGIAPLI